MNKALLVFFVWIMGWGFSTSGVAREFPEGKFLDRKKSLGMQVIGDANFEKIRSLPNKDSDRVLAEKIAYLEIKLEGGETNACSGFLIGPDLLLTNHHCVYINQQLVNASSIRVYMNYLDDSAKGSDVAVSEVVSSDQKLDYALLRLDQPLGETYGWLKLATNVPQFDNGRKYEVKISQHPRGRSKEIARSNSSIVAQNQDTLHYLADTEGGSSGSPVLLKAGPQEVIALHHVGSKKYNEGILSSSILPNISKWLNDVNDDNQITNPDPRDPSNCANPWAQGCRYPGAHRRT